MKKWKYRWVHVTDQTSGEKETQTEMTLEEFLSVLAAWNGVSSSWIYGPLPFEGMKPPRR